MAQQQYNTYNAKIIKGMNQDLGILLTSPETAYKLTNIKNQMVGTALLDCLINEKGTQEITDNDINYESILNLCLDTTVTLKDLFKGKPASEDDSQTSGNGITIESVDTKILAVFKCTQQLSVVFTECTFNYNNNSSSVENCIFKVYQETENSEINVYLLAKGNFNIGENIDAVYCYENDKIQKVYWVDGINVLRYINLYKREDEAYTPYIKDSFYIDSTPEVKYDHLMKVHKSYTRGIFPAGVIQYAFTYYLENGPETAIIDYTPLYYITNKTRGLRADETTMCSFEIEIKNPDTRFDYLRVYSIQRTSLNATPTVRIVKDIKLEKGE